MWRELHRGHLHFNSSGLDWESMSPNSTEHRVLGLHIYWKAIRGFERRGVKVRGEVGSGGGRRRGLGDTWRKRE